MFKVIEFEELSGDGGLSVVREEWLTPQKKECLWPPCKLMSKFNKCLAAGTLLDENWKIYSIKRIFYETDSLLQSKSETTTPKSHLNECNVDVPLLARKTTNPRLLLQDFNIDSPLLSPSLSNTEELEVPPFSPFSPTTKATQSSTLDKINATLDVIGKYLGDIKNDIKELKQTQDDILLRLSSTSSAQASLPENISIPLKEIKHLNDIETCLENEENKEMLENYLSYIGGNKTATIVRRILERVFTNSFATQCNWTGKNNKHKLKDLRLIEVILGAVRRNTVAEKATNAEITDVITNWFRFAKDRDGGREQRRGTAKQ